MEDMTTTTPPPTATAMSPRTSGLAIASLILGICAFMCCVSGALGLILGIIALSKIANSEEPLQGRGLAIAGIITSVVGMIIALGIFAAIMLPAMTKAKSQAQSAVMMSKGKQLAMSMMMYANDNDEKLPDPEQWTEQIDEYLGGNHSVLNSIYEPGAGRVWAMNENLKDLSMSDIPRPSNTVLIFECEPGSPPSGNIQMLRAPRSPRPRGHISHIIVFLDGHIERVKPDRLEDLIWIPEN